MILTSSTILFGLPLWMKEKPVRNNLTRLDATTAPPPSGEEVMFSKNHKSKTAVERMHIARIKEMPCGVCDAPPPSDAHHIEQESHLLVIPLCRDCHQGAFNGLHGQGRIWKTLKKTEMTVLNETIRRMYD